MICNLLHLVLESTEALRFKIFSLESKFTLNL